MRKPLTGLVLVAACVLTAMPCSAQSSRVPAYPTTTAQKPSGLSAMGDSLSSGFKKGLDALGKPFESLNAKDAPPDPTRLDSRTKPSAELYLAVARSQEEKNQPAEAEANYRKALQASPRHLGAMLAYGRFLARQGRVDQAVGVYQNAVKTHPQDPQPHNDLGLCLASHGAFEHALAAFEHAARLEPKRAIYRNNAATVLVELGNHRAAFGHLRAVHDEATAYYNLGYLLQKQGNADAALKHFAAAIDRNPNMNEARVWVEHLRHSGSETATPARIARRPNAENHSRTPVPTHQPAIEIGLPTTSTGRPSPPAGHQTPTSVMPAPTSTPPLAPTQASPWSASTAAPNQNPVLNQPTRATAPVNTSRYASLAPDWNGNAVEVADRRSDVTSSNVASPTTGTPWASPNAVNAGQQATTLPPQSVNVSTSPRWGSLFEQQNRDESAATARPPITTTRAPAAAPRSNNVVYPLPSVD